MYETWQDAFAGFGMRLAVFVRRFSKQGEKPGARTKKRTGRVQISVAFAGKLYYTGIGTSGRARFRTEE